MPTSVPLKALLQTSPELRAFLADPISDKAVSFSLEKGVTPFADRLKEIHYSWLQKALDPFSENDKALLASALDAQVQAKLGISSPPLPQAAQAFIRETLAKRLFGTVAPVEYLPSHPLLPLAHMRKSHIVKIIDYLGLRDLARELAQVIRADTIKALESILSAEKLHFVKHIMQEGEPIRFAPLHLEKWDGNIEAFKRTLHVRGINRLAKALYGCDPTLLWHIMRRLDTDRASLLEKHCTDPKNPHAHRTLVKQVAELMENVA